MSGRSERRLFAAFGFITAFLGVCAAQAGYCDNATTTVEMINCAGNDLKTVDARLNATYKKHRAGLDDQARILLRDAQRAWIAYRDRECLRQRDTARGGTMAPLLEIGCKTTLSEQRIIELQATAETQMAGPDEAHGYYWKSGPRLRDTFDCQAPMDARIALKPGFNTVSGKPMLSAHIAIGDHALDFPIGTDSQDAFCGADIKLSVTDAATGCPGIRADDGLCDAIRIAWDKERKQFVWSRN